MAVQYSERFKARMVQRMMTRGGPSAYELSREVGVAQSTLWRWRQQAANLPGMKPTPRPEPPQAQPGPARRPDDWTPHEKVEAVLEAASLDDAALGPWLRRKGLKDDHLTQWRDVLLERSGVLFGPPLRPDASVRKEVQRLEKELDRKDKALAETAALLVLQGKVEALWAEKGAATRPMNDTPFLGTSKKRERRGRG